jgi:hypothetical protein
MSKYTKRPERPQVRPSFPPVITVEYVGSSEFRKTVQMMAHYDGEDAKWPWLIFADAWMERRRQSIIKSYTKDGDYHRISCGEYISATLCPVRSKATGLVHDSIAQYVVDEEDIRDLHVAAERIGELQRQIVFQKEDCPITDARQFWGYIEDSAYQPRFMKLSRKKRDESKLQYLANREKKERNPYSKHTYYVYDNDILIGEFELAQDAARKIGVSPSAISKALLRGSTIQGRYAIEKVKE